MKREEGESRGWGDRRSHEEERKARENEKV